MNTISVVYDVIVNGRSTASFYGLKPLCKKNATALNLI
jgi:hypothetical protein